MSALSGLAQSTKNLQNRPNGKGEAKFQKLNSEKVRQYENGQYMPSWTSTILANFEKECRDWIVEREALHHPIAAMAYRD